MEKLLAGLDWGKRGGWNEYIQCGKSAACTLCHEDIPITIKPWGNIDPDRPGVFQNLLCPACYERHVLGNSDNSRWNKLLEPCQCGQYPFPIHSAFVGILRETETFTTGCKYCGAVSKTESLDSLVYEWNKNGRVFGRTPKAEAEPEKPMPVFNESVISAVKNAVKFAVDRAIEAGRYEPIIEKKSVFATLKSYEDNPPKEYTFEINPAAAKIIMEWKDEIEPIAETTHSCTLEFPNGDIVEIPGPGEEWESEVVFDEWTVRKGETWGYRAWEVKDWTFGGGYRISICDSSSEKAVELDPDFTHEDGTTLCKEYKKRINVTEAIVLSLTKHTRTYTPEPPKKDMLHEALSAFPLLNGVE